MARTIVRRQIVESRRIAWRVQRHGGAVARAALVTGVVLGTVLGGGCATSRQPSEHLLAKEDEALDFYPLLLGWGWAYEIERDGNTVLAPYSVVERTGDRAVVRNGDQSIVYAILPDGIARWESGLVGDHILRNPVRKGTAWPVQNGNARIVEAAVTIALASGVYHDCALVEEVRREPDRVTRTTYCRGVGPTDIEVRLFDPLTKSFATVAHARLLALTRPGSE
jgi:hypothetical protein